MRHADMFATITGYIKDRRLAQWLSQGNNQVSRITLEDLFQHVKSTHPEQEYDYEEIKEEFRRQLELLGITQSKSWAQLLQGALDSINDISKF